MKAHSSTKFMNMNVIFLKKLCVHFARTYYSRTAAKFIPTPLDTAMVKWVVA